MKIVRKHPARLNDDRLGTSVVIDVLRATTTAAVLMARGASRMLAVESSADLESVLAGQETKFLIVSELDELERRANRIDNSPVAAREIDLGGRIPILVTTNGTRALSAAVHRSDEVLLAGFCNLRRVADHLRQRRPEQLTLLPAGRFADATGRIEDDLCAEMLHELLLDREPREADIIRRIREDEAILRRLAQPGFEGDLELALTVGAYDVLPYVAGEDGCALIVEALRS